MASILDTPTSVAAATHTFSVSAGTNRALVVFINTEGTQSGDITCTYGGETMVNVVQEIAGSGSTQQTVAMFFLNDAGIQAASGTTISAGNLGSTDNTISAASYEDCVQTTPTNTDTDTSAASTPNPLAALDITTSADASIVAAGSGMGNAGSAAWASPLTERTDQAAGSSNGSYADDEVASASTLVACECTWTTQNRAAAVAMEIEHAAAEGISSIDPTEFDMDNGDVDINGLNFLASQGSGTVYISDANTLAGSVNEVEIANGVNTWSDTVINLDLTGLNATEVTNLNTLGPGTRYIIVVNNDSDEYGSLAITLHRAEAFVMSLGAGTPGATTARLTAPTTKTTGDFDAGRFEEAANPATAVDITADNYTEMVWSIEAKDLAREVSYDFRVTKAGAVIEDYTVTPQVTVSGTVDFTGTAAAVTSVIGALALMVGFGGTAAASTQTTAEMAAERAFTGTSAAVTQVVADLTHLREFSGTAAAAAEVTASAGVTRGLAGTSAATTSVTAALGATRGFAGTSAAATTITAVCIVERDFSGASAAATSITADLTVGAEITFTGTAPAATSITVSTLYYVPTLEQTASNSGSGDVTATFGATPTEGNLLFAIGSERSGATSASMLSSGWTLVSQQFLYAADSTYRRAFIVWAKIAGPSEPTAVEINIGGNVCGLRVEEYSFRTDMVFEDVSSADSGDSSQTVATLNTGTVGPLTGEFCFFVFGFVKQDGSETYDPITWADKIGTYENVDVAPEGLIISTGAAWRPGLSASTPSSQMDVLGTFSLHNGLTNKLVAFESGFRTLTGTADAATSITADLSVGEEITFSGTAAAATSITAAVLVDPALTGTSAAATSITAGLDLARGFSGSAGAATSVVADLTVIGAEVTFTGTAAAATVVTVDLDVLVPFTGTSAATTAITAGLGVEKDLAGTADAATSIVADLVVGGQIDLTGTAAASTSIAGALAVDRAFLGTSEAETAISAALLVSPAFTGTAAAATEITADIDVLIDFAGTAAAATSVTATVTPTRGFTGTTAAQSTISAALTANPGFAGSAAAQTTVTAAMGADRAFAATASAVTEITAFLLTGELPTIIIERQSRMLPEISETSRMSSAGLDAVSRMLPKLNELSVMRRE